ncbi:MAG: SoxR reducing system RseC family protein [Candidatus Symbiodolus clandestinus]
MMSLAVEVVDLQQGMAIVRLLKPLGCGNCHRQSIRGAFCASQADSADKGILRLPAPVNARIGQLWQLQIDSAAMVRFALTIYLGPLLVLLFTALILERCAISEFSVVCSALLAAGSGWLVIHFALIHHTPLVAKSVKVKWTSKQSPWI